MSRTVKTVKTVMTVVGLAAAGLLVAGCASGSGTPATSPSPMPSGMPMTTAPASTGTSASGPHNAADVTFLTDMIPHHRQAVEMDAMAAQQATDARVKALATTITTAQSKEISEMTGWLRGWAEPVPASMSGMAMGSGEGMMSQSDMDQLGRTTGAAFDRMWVSMMIRHHQGAVTMANTELQRGQNAATRALAQSIVTSQTAQIKQMTTLLSQLPTA